MKSVWVEILGAVYAVFDLVAVVVHIVPLRPITVEDRRDESSAISIELPKGRNVCFTALP
jgi:hypothetical protein